MSRRAPSEALERPQLFSTCVLCAKALRRNEPFLPALVLGPGGKVINVAFHLACQIQLTAQQLGELLEEPDEDDDNDDPDFDELARVVGAKVGRQVARIVREHFDEED